MKQCNKCKENKELSQFTNGQLKRKSSWCRSCESISNSENYKKNAEKIKAQTKAYVENNREKVKIQRAKHRKKNRVRIDAAIKEWVEKHREESNEIKVRWVKNNPEKRQISANKWVNNNPEKVNAQTAKYRATKLNATPFWLTEDQQKDIKEIYALAKELQWLSEEPLHIDHVMPLVNENICGLHVPWNLQIIPKSMNIKKGNRF